MTGQIAISCLALAVAIVSLIDAHRADRRMARLQAGADELLERLGSRNGLDVRLAEEPSDG